MPQLTTLCRVAMLALVLSLVGCASTHPVAYAGIDSAPHLKPNPDDSNRRIPYLYSEKVDWQQYAALLVDPVAIYHGQDAQFQDISEDEKNELAAYMQSTFTDRLATRFKLVQTPQARALRLKLTLTGAEKSTQGVSTILHFDIAGGMYNVVQAIRGGQPAATGSASYAVEIYDATSNRLLSAYVTKRYPRAMNVAASFGALHAARSGIERGASSLTDELK